MSSIFKENEEEIRKREMESLDFTSLLEKGIKTCHLDSDLELLLYDISDAIKESQILLVEAKKGREEAYLIPLLLAYQNTTFFNRFIIATASSTARENIIQKLQQISKLLGVDIPIHVLENERKYICLKRLKGYNQKRKKKLSSSKPNSIKKEEWRKIQVRTCTLSSCSFFKKCKYALAYTSISQKGCSIISHATLIGNRRFLQNSRTHGESDIIIIDEADSFTNNIRDSYQQIMSYDYICNCFSRAKQLLNRTEYSYIENRHFNELQHFFEELSTCERGLHWHSTEELQNSARKLAEISKRILIHLTRQYAVKHFSKETEQFCEMILIIEKFFEDMANQQEYHFQLQEKERSKNTPNYRKVQVFYYPKQVNSIIANSLKKVGGSIVFTGNHIAGDNDYQLLINDCGLEEIDKPKVKEFVVK